MLAHLKNVVSGDTSESDDEGGLFSFKLTQIEQKQGVSPNKKSSPLKKLQASPVKSSLGESLRRFDEFMLKQKEDLPNLLAQQDTELGRKQVLDAFFQIASSEHTKISQMSLKANSYKSPKKSSPTKRVRPVDENVSPDQKAAANSFISPVKKNIALQPIE